MTTGAKLCAIDGTYELFRAYFGAPSRKTPSGEERGATLGMGMSLLSLLVENRFTHLKNSTRSFALSY